MFPFANRGKPVDPKRPCTNIASSWWTVRKDAGVACRLHDLRHTYASRLIEAGASEAIVREMIGHVDKQVLQRYTHIRRNAKKEATERAFGKKLENHVKESPKVEPKTATSGDDADSAKALKIQ